MLIDDDSLMRMTWQIAAKEQAKLCRCFASPEDFFAHAFEISVESPILIDVDLGNGVRGEDMVDKLVRLGFRNIALTTGFQKESIRRSPFVRRIIGKTPAFEESAGARS